MINSIIRNALLTDNVEVFKKYFNEHNEEIYNYYFAHNNVFSYAILQHSKKIINFLCNNIDYNKLHKSNPLITAAFMNQFSLIKKITPKVNIDLRNEYSTKTGKNALSTYLRFNIDHKNNYKETNALIFFSKSGYRFDLPVSSENTSPVIFEIIKNNPEILKEEDFLCNLFNHGLSADLSYKNTPLLFSIIYNTKKLSDIPLSVYLSFFERSEQLKSENQIKECFNLIIKHQKNGQKIVEDIENYILKKQINNHNTTIYIKQRL